MTKTQIWVAVFLGVFLILFGISYVTSDKTPPAGNQAGSDNQSQNIQQADKELSAMALIKNNGCTSCHGPELKGTRLAPALADIKKNWSRDDLIAYLRNPSSFMDKDRFRQYREKYPSTMMPPFNHLDIKDLGKIADYLIQL